MQKVKEYIDSGLLGKGYDIMQRLNLGIIRQDVNALCNFAPHDLSIINYWLGATPTDVVARGYSYIQPGIEDVVFVTLDYPGGVGRTSTLVGLTHTRSGESAGCRQQEDGCLRRR